jgi:hypothetical protein
MPKASVYEDRCLEFRQDEIWRPRKAANMQPISQTARVEKPPNGNFRSGVRSANRRHHSASRRTTYNIHRVICESLRIEVRRCDELSATRGSEQCSSTTRSLRLPGSEALITASPSHRSSARRIGSAIAFAGRKVKLEGALLVSELPAERRRE